MVALADVDDVSDLNECFKALEPTEEIRLLDWATENAVNHKGRPYDHSFYPHIGAPGGPMDAFDDHRIRTIVLQWASRLGKSFFGQCATLYTADVDPAPMMFASSDKKLAVEVTKRTYKMIRKCKLSRQLKKRTRQDLIELQFCEMFIAWARSASTLADKDIKVGHANEIDKWEQESTATEADPLKLFSDRGKDFQSTRKFIYESTPTIRGKSRVEHLRIQGTNCRFYVPCPHCQEYQTLEFDQIKWRKGLDGRSNPDIARKTAYYECAECGGIIKDHHRIKMMRAGVWCPEGAKVKSKAAMDEHARRLYAKPGDKVWDGWSSARWIDDEPTKDSISATYLLSSYYALAVGWGDIAAEFIESKVNPQLLRNFINQWDGTTWEIAEQKQTFEQLGNRIIVSLQRGLVPATASMITIGVDKQSDFYVFVIVAWSPGQASHIVDYGAVESVGELSDIITGEWFYEDSETEKLNASMTLIDSGFRPKDVHALVAALAKRKVTAYACKGPSQPLSSWYEKRKNGKTSANPNKITVWVDIYHSEDWVDERLHVLTPNDEGGLGLFAGSIGEHQDFLEQLLNMHLAVDLDSHKNEKEIWERIDDNVPNDYRDCLRYALAAMLLRLRGKAVPIRGQLVERPRTPTRPNSRVHTLDGRPYLATER